jgi:hypothetical protein
MGKIRCVPGRRYARLTVASSEGERLSVCSTTQ